MRVHDVCRRIVGFWDYPGVTSIGDWLAMCVGAAAFTVIAEDEQDWPMREVICASSGCLQTAISLV